MEKKKSATGNSHSYFIFVTNKVQRMKSSDAILEYTGRFVSLNENEREEFAGAFREKKVKKRQLLVQPGFIARHRYYVLKGALRAYVIGDEGQDHTIQLAIEDWWISDYNSYIHQEPATMFVTAVEDSELLEISYDDEQTLKASNHKFETFFRIIAERSGTFMQRRVITNITKSAEERYSIFLNKYSSLAERMPQYVIASYLGMTTEFLSKIRNKKLRKKS